MPLITLRINIFRVNIHRATALLREGCGLDEISARLGLSMDKVIQDLRLQAGEGELKLSEIFFAILPEKRARIESVIREAGTSSPTELQKLPALKRFAWHEIDLYCRLRDPRVFRGDLYEYLADTELALHRIVKTVLVEAFGPEENQWWRQGVPGEIRKACVQIREDDPEPVDDNFAYTTLIQLGKIIDQSWNLFRTRLPSELAQDKKRLLREFARLNSLRNGVMHPVKGKTWGREDFEFVWKWHRYFVGARPT